VVSGSIPYRKAGILDDTHLRFFTRAGVESLFAECGFAVQAIARTQLAFGTPSNLVPDVRCMRVPVEIERLVREDPESETLQFVVRATPLPGPWDMSALRGVVHDLEARIEESTVGIGNLERSAALLREGLASAQAERDAALARCAEQERVLRGECDALRAELARTERARDEHAEAARAAAEAGETALARAAEAHQHEALAAAEAAEAADARVRDALGRSDASESMMRRAQAAADDAERRAAEASARAEAAASEAAQRAAEIGALREQLDAALRERDEATAQGARARDLAGEWAARAAAATNRTTDETARADAADAREREATARAADAASRAAALTARFAEATEELRTAQARARAAEAELDETRRQMQEIHEDRNRLLLREADRQSLLTVLEDYETHTSDVALGDGRQAWSTTPARP
jgi:chromosome segregation ATPase